MRGVWCLWNGYTSLLHAAAAKTKPRRTFHREWMQRGACLSVSHDRSAHWAGTYMLRSTRTKARGGEKQGGAVPTWEYACDVTVRRGGAV